jgi:hypothetical protein
MYLAFDWSLLRSGKIKILFPDARVRGDWVGGEMPISTPSTSLGTATVEVDALVVGAGAAGMTAALVSSLEGLDVMLLTGQTDTPLPLLVSLANRFLIVTYCIWLMAAAWAAAWKRPYSPAPRRWLSSDFFAALRSVAIGTKRTSRDVCQLSDQKQT